MDSLTPSAIIDPHGRQMTAVQDECAALGPIDEVDGIDLIPSPIPQGRAKLAFAKVDESVKATKWGHLDQKRPKSVKEYGSRKNKKLVKQFSASTSDLSLEFVAADLTASSVESSTPSSIIDPHGGQMTAVADECVALGPIDEVDSIDLVPSPIPQGPAKFAFAKVDESVKATKWGQLDQNRPKSVKVYGSKKTNKLVKQFSASTSDLTLDISCLPPN